MAVAVTVAVSRGLAVAVAVPVAVAVAVPVTGLTKWFFNPPKIFLNQCLGLEERNTGVELFLGLHKIWELEIVCRSSWL